MKAMVLCAGLGTRLRPVTEVWPKPAIPLLGRPLVAYALGALSRVGISQVVVNTHHLPTVMETAALTWAENLKMSVQFSNEPEILGTGGGIRKVRPQLEGDDFVVWNGDILCSFDLQPAIEHHRAQKAAATMVLLPMPEGEKFNPVEIDAKRQVRRIAGIGPGGVGLTPWHFSGIHILSSRVFQFMAPAGFEDIKDAYDRLMRAGELLAAYIPKTLPYWSDVGTIERYLKAHEDLLARRVQTLNFGAIDPFAQAVESKKFLWQEPGSQAGNARIAGPAWLGEGCQLGSDVQLGAYTSVGRNAVVESGAKLNRCAVLDGALVRAGFKEDEVLF